MGYPHDEPETENPQGFVLKGFFTFLHISALRFFGGMSVLSCWMLLGHPHDWQLWPTKGGSWTTSVLFGDWLHMEWDDHIYIYTPLIFPDSVIHMYCPIISYAIYWNSLRQVSSQPKSPDALEKTSQKTTKILCEIILKSLEFTGQFLTLTLKSLNS